MMSSRAASTSSRYSNTCFYLAFHAVTSIFYWNHYQGSKHTEMLRIIGTLIINENSYETPVNIPGHPYTLSTASDSATSFSHNLSTALCFAILSSFPDGGIVRH